ncbi:MAG: hypothetical protein J0L99_08350 [Chitinophagales bacterium]|nr:hypothetical protein [Chitinophagales bacterium]
MMSKPLFLVCFLFIVNLGSAFAQSARPYFARAQGGYGLCGSGDRQGYVADVSVGKYLLPRLKAGIGVAFADFDNGVYNPASENQALAWSVNLNGYFDIVSTRLVKLELGAGPNIQLWDWNYKAPANTTYVLDDDLRVMPGQAIQFDEWQVGYTLSAGVLITPTEKLELGLWGVHQNGVHGNNISTVRVGMGVKF